MANLKDLIVNGVSRFLGKVFINDSQINTINGVTVGSNPKFTDNNTTYSAGTGLSLSGTSFSVKTGYTTSGNNRAVQADSNGNLYVTQKDDNSNTTYTFANGTNGFTVTPSGGSAQTVTVTPSISNNITGSGTSGYIAKFNGGNTITSGPQIGSSTTTYLRNDGTWATPPGTTYSSKAAASGGTDVSLVTTGEKYTWNSKTSNTGTVTSVATGVGLTGGSITTSGTLKAKLRSETALTNDSSAATETSGRVYPVAVDKSGYLAVNVPWTDNNTTYSAGTGLSLSSGSFSVKLSYTTSGNNRAVQADSNGNLYVTQKDDNTTYSAGTGLSLSGTKFNHSNSVTAGTAGTSSATSGSTLAVPYVTYDAQGHVTGSGTHTHTISGFLTSHQDISGKADKSATVSTVTYDTTNKKFTKTINGSTTDIVTVATLKTDLQIPSNYLIADDAGTAVDPNPINANTLEGHAASYFATASALSTTNSNLALKAPIASPSFTGTATVAAGTNYTTAKLRNIIISTQEPTSADGNNGDIWIVYEEE